MDTQVEHLVTFFPDEFDLGAQVHTALVAAVERGETCIVIATEAHRRNLWTSLTADGVHLARARTTGALIELDAAATLAQFMLGGMPDARLFDAVIGGVVREAVRQGPAVFAFGEMVGLLWDSGLVLAALALEALWDELREEVPFTLFCGYPHAPFVPASPTAVRRVCECHTSVVGHVPPAIAVHARRAFAPTLDSTAAARRFARTTFREWGRVDLADDAAGIVAELATNAVLHARSDYTVDLGFDGHTGRVEVRDTNPRMLHSVARGRFAEDGRGLILVAGLASDWGVTALPDGKVVWAQLGGD